jgi:uncharacterized damage-inducible protein DinB
MDRGMLVRWWDEAWTSGLWAAGWKQSLEGLTAVQAAWRPAAGRHSIWQIVHHMLFWREVALKRLAGGSGTSEDETARENFRDPAPVNEAAWQAMLRKLAESQKRFAAALADPRNDLNKLAYVLPHDCYHMGQINYLRALQGLKPIE